MITLYDYLPSQNAWKVRQILHHLGIPYRTEIVSIFFLEFDVEACLDLEDDRHELERVEPDVGKDRIRSDIELRRFDPDELDDFVGDLVEEIRLLRCE